MLQFSFHTGDFSLHVNHVTQRHSILCRTYHEGSSTVRFGIYHIQRRKITHLYDDRIECSSRVLTKHLQLQCFLLSNILLQTNGTNTTDNFFHRLKLLNHITIHIIIHGQRTHHNTFTRLALIHLLPEFFGNERHERMKQTKQIFKEAYRCTMNRTVNPLPVSRFYHFKIPGRKLIPEQLINSHKRLAQTILAEQIGYFSSNLVLLRLKPCHCQFCSFRNRLAIINRPAAHQTESIPYLIAEVTSLFTKRIIKQYIISGRGCQHHTHTHAISTIPLNQFQRIGRVTE